MTTTMTTRRVYTCVTSCWVVVVLMLGTFEPVGAITLSGGETSYARYPVWNGCHQNGSFSFEFKTTKSEGLLWYVDDGGRYDFFMVSLSHGGRVRLVLNVVDERDGNVEIILGVGLNDGRWHHVEIRRKRMETTLIVDDMSDRRYSFGSDFYFGNNTNSYVYLGGVPSYFRQSLESLSLPSVTFEPRFRGQMRNVMFGNCTCQTTRGTLIDGVGVSQVPPEVCEIRNPCPTSCVCVSTDDEPKCNCSQQQCVTGMSVHYELPMDRLEANTVLNPSGLDARAYGSPSLTRGIKGNTIELDGRTKYVKVSGPGHRNECFGDLDKCPTGYTLAYWLNFTSPLLDPYRAISLGSTNDSQFIYLSNGAHTSNGHGVAMIYNPLTGRLDMLFKRKSDGAEWRVKSDNIVPGRWYHVAASWDKRDGVTLFVNGDRADTAIAPQRSSSSTGDARVSGISGRDDFVIGRANDATSVFDKHVMLIDEFNFWSMVKNLTEIRESGPFYCYRFSMDSRSDVENYASRTLRATVNGNPQQVTGKIGNALKFDGQRDYIDGGDHSATCLGNLTLCKHGITISAWVRFDELRDGAYLLSSGNNGLKLFYKDGGLVAEAQEGFKSWTTTWHGVQKDKWHFVELTWHPESGIKLFVDLQEVAGASWSKMKEPERDGSGNLFIGRGSKVDERPAAVTIDDLEVWYGDRESLIYFDFISRGRPVQHVVPMDELRYGRVTSPSLRVEVTGQPQLTDGKFGRAVSLDGRGQHMSIERQSGECLGNLDLCRHGLLLTGWVKPGQLQEGMTLLSTGYNGIIARYVNGQLEVTARTTDREWTVRTDRLQPNQWQFIEIAWNPKDGAGGLELYMDEQRVAQTSRSSVRTEQISGSLTRDQNTFFIGRGDGTQANARYGNFAIDEFEYWYNNREYLIAFGYLQRGRPSRYYFDMNKIEGNRLVHPNITVTAFGQPTTVPGRVSGATLLNGNNQYLDIGDFSSECLGNLARCEYGITGSMFIKPLDDKDDTYYLSTGGATRIFQERGRLVVVSETDGKRWEVTAPSLEKNKWHFVEYSWHPSKGLQVYVNNKLIGEGSTPTTVPKRVVGGHVLVGGANPTDTRGGRFQYANALFDEIEFWMRDRESLIASGYILRDDVDHIVFPFERQRGNAVVDNNYTVTLHNGAILIPARIGNGVSMEGTGEYVTLGNQQSSCMGNLELCKHGLTIKFYLNPRRLINNAQYLASGPYTVYSKDGKIFVKFSTPTKTWEVSTNKVRENDWHKMEVSWDEKKGLELYVNGEQVASTSDYQSHTARRVTDHAVYLGRPTEDNTDRGLYADAIVDHLEFWFAHRDRLTVIGGPDDEDLKSFTTQRPLTSPRGGIGFPLPTRPPGSEKKWFVFDGKTWLSYDFSELPPEYLRKNSRENIHISFQTNQPDGLLWYIGNNTNNMHLSVKDGSLYFITTAGSTREEFKYGLGSSLNDNKWHDVYLTKEDRQVKIVLDGTEFPSRRLSSDITLINPSTVYLGGSNNTYHITRNHIRHNFEGRIGEAVMSGNTLPSDLNLIDLALIKPSQKFIFIEGDLVVVDPDIPIIHPSEAPSSGPITFTSERVFLRVPAWPNQQMNSLEFFFKTVEPRGLILYSGSPDRRADSFAVEIFDGVLYVNLNLGGSNQRFTFNGRNLNDGQPHHVKVNYSGRNLVLTLDGAQVVHRIGDGDGVIDLAPSAMVGAAEDRLPWHLWSMKQNYFKGCLWGLRFNDGDSVDLESIVRSGRMPGIEAGCLTRPPQCLSGPCMNSGRCTDTWDGYVCDCSDTAYTGRRCETRAPFVGFSGGDMVRISVRPTVTSHTNDISLRFKTVKEDGLLFATSTHFSDDYLKAFLENGRVVVETNVDGEAQPLRVVTGCDRAVNDDQWHTLHIKRRANHLQAYVDNCSPTEYKLAGEGYTLNIDEVVVGQTSLYDFTKDSFIGHMQNFYFDDSKFFERLPDDRFSSGYNFTSIVNITSEETNILALPVTFRNHKDAYLEIPGLQLIDDSSIKFAFKTTNKDGLLLYNGGSQGNFFAVELVNGILRTSANDGSGPQVVTAGGTGSLADDQWHIVEIRQTGAHSYEIIVDGRRRSNLNLPSSRNTLDLVGVLYVGGVPDSIRRQLPSTIASRTGFSGCFASLIINGRLVDLLSQAIHSSKHVTTGCTRSDIATFCGADTCKHFGICMEELNGYSCDCNLTSFTGRHCTEESEGFRYGEFGERGITIFTFAPPIDTTSDKIAFGFNTWQENGTLIHIISSTTGNFIDAKLVNGHVVFTYDIGDGIQRIAETRKVFNDGRHHYVVFQRTGSKATLRVDDQPIHVHETSNSQSTLFRDMWLARIGGNVDQNNNIIEHFDGIISGVYINGQRIIDLHLLRDSRVRIRQVTVAQHPFYVPKIIHPVVTQPPIVVVPTKKEEPQVPPLIDTPSNGGGGIVVDGNTGEVIIDGGDAPKIAQQIAAPVSEGSGEGARAAGVAGAMLGALAAVSSLMWALYKFKPGLIGLGGVGGSSSAPLLISAPQANTSAAPPPLGAGPGGALGGAPGGGLGSAPPAGAGGGGGYGSTGLAMTEMYNGSGAVVAQQANLAQYFSSMSQSASSTGAVGGATGASGGAAGAHGAAMYSTINRGIQTDSAAGGGDAFGGSSMTTTKTTTYVFENRQMGAGGLGGYSSGQAAGFNSLGSAGVYSDVDGFASEASSSRVVRSLSPPPADSSFQMRNMTLNYSAMNQQDMLSSQSAAYGASGASYSAGGLSSLTSVPPNLMASEEIRVDCVQLTNNGRYVVTGSIYGPPQVWDMQTGELIRVMRGEDFSSTDLHLANGDTLLVGQVAEMEQVDPNDVASGNKLHYRKLQTWDFNTGLPLEMRKNELCTASCLMNDGERMVLGRTERFGGGTTIVIWDILGNEPVRQIKYDACVGFADHVSYLNLSTDNRYVIAGFQNSFDGNANFISFDLTVNDINLVPPQVTALNAVASVTAVLENHEAVTGTRAGELIIWSMRTGKALRQLVLPGGGPGGFSHQAHQKEITDLVISKDRQYLVSASADSTLKIWSTESEKLLRVLAGHKDEVWCCCISNDNELVVSGSRDNTIRLWRLQDGGQVAAINAGVDVFKVLLSNNKKTIVALADKYSARKLIMLQVVRTKTKMTVGSRPTSPWATDARY